jgi:hypothetical protein
MIIRKVSIGSDYKNAMNYMHGQSVLQGNYVIHLIKQDVSSNDIEIFIERDNEVVLWKKINGNMPFIIEYNIDF